ncbi:TPA: hypothetical protein ACX6SJ_003768 [Photobacterium damselae]
MKKNIYSPDGVYFLKVDETGLSMSARSIHLKSNTEDQEHDAGIHFDDKGNLTVTTCKDQSNA